MTIYYYASDSVDGTFKGMPVVLNFTDSNCYLKCGKERDTVSLRIGVKRYPHLRGDTAHLLGDYCCRTAMILIITGCVYFLGPWPSDM